MLHGMWRRRRAVGPKRWRAERRRGLGRASSLQCRAPPPCLQLQSLWVITTAAVSHHIIIIISSVPRTAPLSTAAISVGNHYCSCKPPHHHHHLFSAAHRPRRPVDDEAEVADEARDQAAYGRADARRSSGTGAAAADAERGTGVRRTVRAFDEAGPDPPGSRAAVCAAARDIRPCAQLQEIE